jgi:5-methylcytosine-specific restriction enzyme B
MYVSEGLLEEAIRALHVWFESAKRQHTRHVWSFLPVKLKGAMPGKAITYREEDDKDFFERFFEYRAGAEPFFDPFSRDWLKAGYPHSNAATFRKRTFMMSWKACLWEDNERLTLAEDYHEIVRDKVLTKAESVFRVPAVPLAIWFYKRPSVEWPTRSELQDGIPDDPAELLNLFRQDFHFDGDAGWTTIFDTEARLPGYGRESDA